MGGIEAEAASREAVAALKAASIDAKEVLDGNMRFVVARSPDHARSVRIHCLWFDGVDPAIMFERRSPAAFEAGRLGRLSTKEFLARQSYRGPVFSMTLYDQMRLMAEGSAGKTDDVVACTSAWLEGKRLDELAAAFSFINDAPGVLRAITPSLDSSVRWEFIGAAPFNQLWVYGGGRACKLTVGSQGIGGLFYVGVEPVATATVLEDANAAVAAWLVERVSLPQLSTRIASLELAEHALLVETDPSRRHWLILRDETARPEHPLGHLHELISALADSPTASRFYAFRLTASLQFAASSHPDWVTEKMPYVSRTEAGTYEVAGELTREVGDAVRLVEAELIRSGMKPFFGSAAHYELEPLLEGLARQGSSLQPVAIQRGDRYRLLVSCGERECQVIGTRVFFAEGRRRTQAQYSSVDLAASAIHRFLEQSAPFDGLPA